MKLYRDFTSQEEIDLEYNMAITVPDTKRWMEKVYVQESAKVRHELKCELDVRFGPTVDETVDVFPAKEPGAALLVFIHGGYWNWGSSKEFSLVARGPVAHGVTVVVTNQTSFLRHRRPDRRKQPALQSTHRFHDPMRERIGPGFKSDHLV
uniref:Alpha/beta hydrolase fold-3 domain-containing protein n=1 Tax=Candidatus Methanophaga sp. ANME-1 ERB7 TaxID=2759913 RepID=A0A7G9Z4U9_9EURY|nr:hypothetical protein NKHFOMCA_00026 [Methanosarcinales archaeon ANME-1 ERB7]QNO57479.1 hypothetical protein PBOADKMI_00024 [Methanosarcinales archaeon ANME-1 ERB7]